MLILEHFRNLPLESGMLAGLLGGLSGVKGKREAELDALLAATLVLAANSRVSA